MSENQDEMTGVVDTYVEKEHKDGGSGLSTTRSRSVVHLTDVPSKMRTDEEGMKEVRWPVNVFCRSVYTII